MPYDNPEPEHETPLPSTLLFVLVMGATFLAGWLVLFLLLKARS